MSALVKPAPAGGEEAFGPLEVGLRGGLVGDQLPGAHQRLGREVAVGLGTRHLRLQFRVVHLEEGSSLRHLVALAEEDAGDAAVHLGAEPDRLDRLDFTGGGDGVHDGVHLGDRGLHEHGRRSAAGTGATRAGGGVTLGAGGGKANEQEQGRVSGHWALSLGKSRRPRITSSPASASLVE